MHKEVSEYLESLRRSVTSQVLIEAKIMEVSLNDQYSTGINWNRIIGADLANDTVAFPKTTGLFNSTIDASSGLSLQIKAGDIDTVIEALQEFGTVRALSSPRLTVLNW
jgi:general secretion pathway protein D